MILQRTGQQQHTTTSTTANTNHAHPEYHHHAAPQPDEGDDRHAPGGGGGGGGEEYCDNGEAEHPSRRPFLLRTRNATAAAAATKKDLLPSVGNPLLLFLRRDIFGRIVHSCAGQSFCGCCCSRHKRQAAPFAGCCCRCCRRTTGSSFRCGVLLLLLLVVFTSVAVPLLHGCAEQLAGDKPLAWRIDVHPGNPYYLLNRPTTNDLRQQQFADGDDDDLSTGRSCEHRRGRWHCRDCGPETAATPRRRRRHSCPALQPRGRCRPFRRDGWDDPRHPRSVSQYDASTDNNREVVEHRTLSTLGGRYFYHSHPQCTVHSPSCWDLDRCANSNSSNSNNNHSSTPPFVLTVFVNTTGPHPLVDGAVASLGLVRRVDRREDACLSLTFPDTYPTVQDLLAAEHWRATRGRNNLVYDWSRFTFHHGTAATKRLSSDAPFSLFHVGRAAVASESLTGAVHRPGYDLVLPLRRQWARAAHPAAVDVHRPRRWLLSFRGSIKNRPQPHYQHRWLAAEYWDTSRNDVLVDVQCTHSWLWGALPRTYKPYDDRSPSIYGDLLWNSTFGFCPGGSGAGTYRLGEVLSTGGIPVVTSDLVLPLQPEVDWTGCAVRVSEARIVDLPALLRRVPAAEVRRRQARCWQLLQSVLGDAPDGEQRQQQQGGGGVPYYRSRYSVTFAKAMEIWAARIETALEMRERLRQINNYEP